MLKTPLASRRTALSAAILASLLALTAIAAPASSDEVAASSGTVPGLHVEGNQIKDSVGNDVTLRGVSVLAPEQNICGRKCNPKPISEMVAWSADANDGWYSRVLRLPVTEVHQYDIDTYYAQHIQPYVQQAIDLGIYVIIDLHYVKDYGSGQGALPQSVVLDFWNYIAPIYANTSNVIFEVFNEPINPDDWQTWKSYIQPVIDSIRSVAPNNLILVGGPQWSTRVNDAAADPLTGGNLVYVYHIYPNQGPATTENLDSRFGNAALTIPVMITEFGWNPSGKYSSRVTAGTTSQWGVPFRQYLDARPHISWQLWIFDNFWKPQIFDENWNLLDGEHQGAYIKSWLFELKDHNQPQQ